MCGITFDANAHQFATCSTACSLKYRSISANAYEWRHIYYFNCKVCGKRYSSNIRKSSGCSPECIHEYSNQRSLDSKWYHWYYRDCPTCGKHYVAHNARSLGCSPECCSKHQFFKTAQKRSGTTGRETFNCQYCGNVVNLRLLKKLRKFCSKRCSRLSTNHVHDARLVMSEHGVYGDKIDPLLVFERDKYRCHICHKKVDMKRRGQHTGNAPELDHILPLSRGGSHTYDNVACSCAKCNRSKHATPLGQMRLAIESALIC